MEKTPVKTQQKQQKHVNILGIDILSTSVSDLLSEIQEKLANNIKFFILTPNPELILASKSDKNLKEALSSADFSVPDGHGLAYASRFLHKQNLNIIPGRILFTELINLANEKNWRVFLLGGEGREAHIASGQLATVYKRIFIMNDAGFKLNKEGNAINDEESKKEEEIIQKINLYKPHFLFVAFGNPKQEIWIYKNLPKLNIGGAMAVGGTFRYVAGFSKLPPKWMAKAGLEWVWRGLTEPKRAKRILTAFPVFPLRVLWYKVTGK